MFVLERSGIQTLDFFKALNDELIYLSSIIELDTYSVFFYGVKSICSFEHTVVISFKLLSDALFMIIVRKFILYHLIVYLQLNNEMIIEYA